MAAAYRANALANRLLFAVIFGSASLGGYRLDATAADVGGQAFAQLRIAVVRAMDAGALRQGDPSAVGGQFSSALHGYVMLELADYHRITDQPERRALADARPPADRSQPLTPSVEAFAAGGSIRGCLPARST